MTTNEAAERAWLANEYAEETGHAVEGQSCICHTEAHYFDVDSIFAAERRATVERIRDWADKHERIGILSYPAAQRLRAILDEEAAR